MPRAKTNGIELEYESLGDGEPLVLIMGLGAQLVLWDDRFCQQLADRGFRVIRFDNRDCGLSTKLDAAGVPDVRQLMWRYVLGLPVEAPYRLSDMAADVVGLMDALAVDRAHVLGVSMGGMIAQTLALEHPARVRSLTSVMSGPGNRWSSVARPRAVRALFRRPPRSREEAMQQAVDFFQVVGGTGFSMDEWSLRERSARQWDRGLHPPGVARHLAAILASGGRFRALRSVRVPTAVVHGAEDPLIPPIAGRLTAWAIPGAELRLIEGMGHDLPSGAWPQIIDAVCRVAIRAAATDATRDELLRHDPPVETPSA